MFRLYKCLNVTDNLAEAHTARQRCVAIATITKTVTKEEDQLRIGLIDSVGVHRKMPARLSSKLAVTVIPRWMPSKR
ncbi:MAG: hypothetical protein JWR21_2854 [Herminiimonas sp.]|nr:hypothetical protein [Herminiimonas sp.]